MNHYDYVGTANWNTSSAVTYTINGNLGVYDFGRDVIRPAREGEIESALQWLDRRVLEICVKL